MAFKLKKKLRVRLNKMKVGDTIETEKYRIECRSDTRKGCSSCCFDNTDDNCSNIHCSFEDTKDKEGHTFIITKKDIEISTLTEEQIQAKFLWIRKYISTNSVWGINWKDSKQKKYRIIYDYDSKCWDYEVDYELRADSVYMDINMAELLLARLNNWED